MKKLIGGIHLNENKFADSSDILTMEVRVGEEFFLPFVQHIGGASEAVVKKGEQVSAGTMIAKSGAGLSVPLHSPIDGVVKDVKNIPHPSLGQVNGCIIEATAQTGEFVAMNASDSFIEHIQNAGIVGLGGAGFPTSVKLKAENIDTLLINASECEPYLTCDNVLMLNKPLEILEATKQVKEFLKASAAVIAIEDNKKQAIELLSKHASKYGVDIVATKSLYPQGGEKQLIYTVLGRTVEAGKLPNSVSVVVQNVATMYAIYEAVTFNKPLYERILTVSGDTNNHVNVLAKLGTPVNRVLEFTNNQYENKKIVMGGPMTGQALSSADYPVLKTTSGVLLFDDKNVQAPTPCIRCGRCISVCTMGLSPTDLEKFYATNDIKLLENNDAMSCIECGCCSYVCPSGRLLAESIKVSKRLITNNKKGA